MRHLIVQKFGGSSVANVARIQRVAKIIHESIKGGSRVVAVVSAMGGETNRLDALARELGVSSGAELDVLLASGEQASAALLAMALQKLGLQAASFCGHQVRFLTSCEHQNARIQSIETDALERAIDEGIIPVVAGFQGVNEDGAFTTLGRGGSDLTAVALSAALRAKECQIYTDTDGVYTADPRIVPDAQKLATISLPLMMDYAQAGAKVLQPRCLELAIKESVPVRVLSSYGEGEGTLLLPAKEAVSEGAVISGIVSQDAYSMYRLRGLKIRPGFMSYCLAVITSMGLPAPEFIQFTAEDIILAGRWVNIGEKLIPLAQELGAESVNSVAGLSKLSILGAGLTAESGYFHRVASQLSREGIDPVAISATSSRIEVFLLESQAARSACALHEALLPSKKSQNNHSVTKYL